MQQINIYNKKSYFNLESTASVLQLLLLAFLDHLAQDVNPSFLRALHVLDHLLSEVEIHLAFLNFVLEDVVDGL